MRVIFDKSSRKSFSWFADYYKYNFPEGKIGAYISLSSALKVLKLFPEAGKIQYAGLNFRSFHINKTPFSLIYKFNKREEIICILYVWDNRSIISADMLL